MWDTQQSEQTRNILTTSCLTTSIPCLQPAQVQSVQDCVKCTYEVVKEADLLDNSVVTNILVVVDIHPCQQTDNILPHRDQMQSRSTVSGLSHVIHCHKPVYRIKFWNKWLSSKLSILLSRYVSVISMCIDELVVIMSSTFLKNRMKWWEETQINWYY